MEQVPQRTTQQLQLAFWMELALYRGVLCQAVNEYVGSMRGGVA